MLNALRKSGLILRFLMGTALGAGILFASLSAAAQSQPASRRNQVVIFMIEEPDTLNPLFSSPGLTVSPGWHIEPLVFAADSRFDNAGRRVPQGVEYMPSVKDGTWRVDGERMTLRWRLRRRAWHDGKTVTCGDYVFAYNVARHPQVAAVSSGYEEEARGISHVQCPQGADGREVVVTYKVRTIFANRGIIGGPPLPRHLLERFFRANPSALDKVPYGREPKATVGDGAYRLVEWSRGQSITVEAVEDHSIFGTPRIKRIVFRAFPNIPPGPGPRVALFLAGEVDVLPPGAVGPPFVSALKEQPRADIRILTHPTLVYETIDFNLDNPLLQDVRVRRAIAHALNRTQIVQQVVLGYGRVAHTYLPPGHPGYTADVRQYSYDPARARALLREAGFAPGPDGIMRTAGGQRLALEINTTAGVPVRDRIEQIVQQQLREVGIDITVVNYPRRVFFGELTDRRKFTGLALYAWNLSPASDCDERWTSDGIPSESNGWRGENIPGYRNVEMDEICTAARNEFDDSRRSQLLRQSARIFSRDLPSLPLYVSLSIAAVRAGLENISPTVRPPYTWNAHEWYWK